MRILMMIFLCANLAACSDTKVQVAGLLKALTSGMTVPGAPTSVVGTAGNGQVSVAFTAPASNGGSPISNYTVTAWLGATSVGTANGPSTPINVSGLSNGQSYTFTVTATNGVGTGAASASSSPVMPISGAPSPPTITNAVPGNGSVTVYFGAATPGAYSISTITITPSIGTPQIFGGNGPGMVTITGLTNGQPYTFTATTMDTLDNFSIPSSAYGPVIPSTTPSAPTINSVVPGDSSATVNFSGGFNGGSPILGFTVTAMPGSIVVNVGAGATSAVFTGLANGTTYSFTMKANNANGLGAASNSMNATPVASVTAQAPTSLSFTATSGTSGNLSFVSGANDYFYNCSFVPSGPTCSGGMSNPQSVSGLVPGQAYTVTITPYNIGAVAGNPSSSYPFTAATVPGVPTGVSASFASAGNVNVSFTAPSFNGGLPINYYVVSSIPSGCNGMGSVSPITVSCPMPVGTAYTFFVAANNIAGTGTAGYSGTLTLYPKKIVSSSNGTMCELYNDKSLSCWGNNTYSQVGNSSALNTGNPFTVFSAGASDVAVGYRHTCAVKDGDVYCWGDNTNGELGLGSNTSYATPQKVTLPLSNMVYVAAGNDITCASSMVGVVYCWGDNTYGKVGVGLGDPNFNSPQQVSNTFLPASSAVALTAMNNHVCATVNSNGYCWGQGDSGQIGDNYSVNRNVPTLVFGSINITQISAGYDNTCATDDGGNLYCWGNNGSAQVSADGSNAVPTFPIPFFLTSNVSQVAAGNLATCAIVGGFEKCWGKNSYNLISLGPTSALKPASAFSGTFGVISLTSAPGVAACVVSAVDGSTSCWGSEMFGSLGNGTVTGSNLAPSAAASAMAN